MFVQFEFQLIRFSSGFVSTDPEPRCVTILEIQTEPARRMAFEWAFSSKGEQPAKTALPV